MKIFRIAVIVAVLGGAAVAVQGGLREPDHSRSPVVVKTRTVEVEKRVEVDIPVVPQACIDLAFYTEDLQEAVARYEDKLGQHQAVIAKSFEAIAQRDIQLLTESDRLHRKLKSETLSALLDIRAASRKVNAAKAGCLAKSK